jgi:plasmid maintenance system antidote protein VapI
VNSLWDKAAKIVIMKSLDTLKKKYSPAELAEAYVFPSQQTNAERKANLKNFQKWNNDRKAQQTPEEKLLLMLLQLRFQMEDYLQSADVNEFFHFGFFLKEYIRRQHKKSKEFAREIDVDATELSQVINRRRPASEKYFIRLEIHSNRNFPAHIWFKIQEKEKLYKLDNDRSLRDKESKHVKKRLNLVF